MGNKTEEQSKKEGKTCQYYEKYWCTTICTVDRIKQFEMQQNHSNVEMYRDTTDCRNIQKQVGAMQEKYGRSDQPFTTYKTKQKQKKA
jgi:hypothetical protein